jgi:lipopolysaccharide export system protein LptA
MCPNRTATCLLCLAWLLPAAATAKPSDQAEPIHLQADRVEINEKKATSLYRGHVHMQQGSLKILADEVLVMMKDGRVDKIVIQGKPASFEQQPEKQPDIVHSKADYMEYFADQERLILKTNAEVTQGKNLFRGDHIEYDTRNSVVKAHKDADSDNRVTAIIQPKTNDPKQEPEKPKP